MGVRSPDLGLWLGVILFVRFGLGKVLQGLSRGKYLRDRRIFESQETKRNYLRFDTYEILTSKRINLTLVTPWYDILSLKSSFQYMHS